MQRLKTAQRHCLKALQTWCRKRGVDVRFQQKAMPFDWCDPDAGTYPKSSLTIEFQGRCTLIEWEQRKSHHNPVHYWNSEHIAWWWGTPGQVVSGTQNGCDVDVVTYTARPLWGLLGEHTYTD